MATLNLPFPDAPGIFASKDESAASLLMNPLEHYTANNNSYYSV